MRVTTLDAHVGGAAVRLVTSGLPQLDGESMADRRRSFEAQAEDIALWLTREPRGHAGMVGVALTLPGRPDCDAGLLCFTGAGPRALSGHAAMAAAALALNHGLITPRQPGTLQIDSEAGPVVLRVAARDGGRVRAVRFEGPPALVMRGDVRVASTRRTLRVDVAWSGTDIVAIVEGEALGVPLSPSHGVELRRAAIELMTTLDGMLALSPPGTSVAVPISACALVGPASSERADVRLVLVRRDGTISRSPSASGTAAVCAVLCAMGLLMAGAESRHESLSGATWTAEVLAACDDASVQFAITDQVYETGRHELVLEGSDPLPRGVPWL